MPRMQDVDPEKWARIQKKFGKPPNENEKPPIRDKAASHKSMPPEHDFAHGSRVTWEDVVFKNATHFTVSRKGKQFARPETKEFQDLGKALKEARKTDPQGMVYAVAGSGRFVMLPPDKLDECLKRWKGNVP